MKQSGRYAMITARRIMAHTVALMLKIINFIRGLRQFSKLRGGFCYLTIAIDKLHIFIKLSSCGIISR